MRKSVAQFFDQDLKKVRKVPFEKINPISTSSRNNTMKTLNKTINVVEKGEIEKPTEAMKKT